MRRVALIALCLVLLAAPALSQTKAMIQQLNGEWVAAFNKGDAAAIVAMYTEDAYVLPAGAQMAKGRRAIQAFWAQAAQQLGDAKLTTVDVMSLGPGAAREIGTFSFKTKGQTQIRGGVAQDRRPLAARDRHLEHEQVAGCRDNGIVALRT
jgi:uncharacterized protein (TIGR02246 family)